MWCGTGGRDPCWRLGSMCPWVSWSVCKKCTEACAHSPHCPGCLCSQLRRQLSAKLGTQMLSGSASARLSDRIRRCWCCWQCRGSWGPSWRLSSCPQPPQQPCTAYRRRTPSSGPARPTRPWSASRPRRSMPSPLSGQPAWSIVASAVLPVRRLCGCRCMLQPARAFASSD